MSQSLSEHLRISQSLSEHLRMSEYVSYLYQPFNPSILKLIKMTIDAAHKNKK